MIYKFAPKFIVLSVSLLFVSCSLLHQKASRGEVDFHLKEMSSNWSKVVKTAGTNEQESCILQFRDHQNALVELGYFERVRYKFDDAFSDKKRASLLKSLNDAIGNVRYGYFEGPEPDTDILTVWFSEEVELEKIEKTYDLIKD